MIATILSAWVLASGQDAPAVPAASTDGAAPETADILISVRAHADEVRWRQVGTVTVRAWAEPGGVLIDENIATGLPRPIPARRTFRDIDWSLRAGVCLTGPEDAEPAGRCAGSARPTPTTGDDPP